MYGVSYLVYIACTFNVSTRRGSVFSTFQLTLGLHVCENGHELNEMWFSVIGRHSVFLWLLRLTLPF